MRRDRGVERQISDVGRHSSARSCRCRCETCTSCTDGAFKNHRVEKNVARVGVVAVRFLSAVPEAIDGKLLMHDAMLLSRTGINRFPIQCLQPLPALRCTVRRRDRGRGQQVAQPAPADQAARDSTSAGRGPLADVIEWGSPKRLRRSVSHSVITASECRRQVRLLDSPYVPNATSLAQSAPRSRRELPAIANRVVHRERNWSFRYGGTAKTGQILQFVLEDRRRN